MRTRAMRAITRMSDVCGRGHGHRPGRRRGRAALAAGVAAVAMTGGALMSVAGCSSSSTSDPPAVNPLTGQGTGGHVLATKIDNVGTARTEQSGLNSADLVYVIQ